MFVKGNQIMKLTIVMYHYVRDIIGSRYPGIKGLEFSGFKRQLDYLQNNYTVISAEDIIDYGVNGKPLPSNACYLTFDDGYKDHIDYVLPELLKRKLQGSFFIPAKAVLEREMLDVNSIHFILATCSDYLKLVGELNSLCNAFSISDDVLREYWSTYAKPTRWDTKEVNYIKNMLQHVLPEKIRNSITQVLFERYVGESPRDFADSLYLSVNDTKKLIDAGMYIGNHGYKHTWLNKGSFKEQESEIDVSLEFLKKIGAPVDDWIMCYPYGEYNEDTLRILHSKKCAIGLTTKVGFANLNSSNLLELARFDTNDFPQ
jgi:peptidoglycan/xylan/chitin deacetylase (PgdA/CDA1 family)